LTESLIIRITGVVISTRRRTEVSMASIAALISTSLCPACYGGCKRDTVRIAAKRRAAAHAVAPLLLGARRPPPAAFDRYLLPARRSAANPPHTVVVVE